MYSLSVTFSHDGNNNIYFRADAYDACYRFFLKVEKWKCTSSLVADQLCCGRE